MGHIQVFYRFPTSLYQYYLLGKQNIFPEINGCPHPNCPYKGRLRHHGFYSRNAISLTRVDLVWIHRYYCPIGRHTVSVLPTYLLPHRQYTVAVVYWILNGLYQHNLPLTELVRRWKLLKVSFSRQYIQHIKRRLEQRERIYRLFLGVDNDHSPIGADIVTR